MWKRKKPVHDLYEPGTIVTPKVKKSYDMDDGKWLHKLNYRRKK